jgi:hypothetical protein
MELTNEGEQPKLDWSLSGDSILTFLPLVQRSENEEEILIGREDISYFVILPLIGIHIIELLQQGISIKETEAIISVQTGEHVDILDFARDLLYEHHFVHKVNHTVVNEPSLSKISLPWLPKRLGVLLFQPWFYCMYGIITLLGIAAALSHTEIMPHYADILISPSITLSLLAIIITEWVFLLIHELAHLLAARSLGISAYIRLSHRIVFPVAETNMSNMVLLPPKQRYKAYLAGMTLECVYISLSFIIQFLHYQEFIVLSPLMLGLLKLIVLTLLISLAFQFLFFMNTDIYYVVTTFLHCNNLLHNTRLYIRKQLTLLKAKELEEWDCVDPREKKIVKWYMWFYVLGVTIAIWLFFDIIVRGAIKGFLIAIHQLNEYSLFSWHFLDGITTILFIAQPFVLLIWSWWRQRKERVRSHNN